MGKTNIMSQRQGEAERKRLQYEFDLTKAIDAMEEYGKKLINDNKDFQKLFNESKKLYNRSDQLYKQVYSSEFIQQHSNDAGISLSQWRDLPASICSQATAFSFRAEWMKNSFEKGKEVVALAQDLRKSLPSLEVGKTTQESASNSAFLTLLHSQDKTLAEHRDYNSVIIKNILLCLGLLGIGYVAAVAFNAIKSHGKNFIFFKNTESQNKQEDIEKKVDKLVKKIGK